LHAPWPLYGLRILDLTDEIAGPYATKLLADAGADVIKLEVPGGDPLRGWVASGHRLSAGQDGALFQFLAASKRSIVADITTPEGRDCALEIARTCDLVFESSGPGVLARAGLDLPTLHASNPMLSLISVSAFGHSGPWAGRPATEFTLQAQAGSTAYRGLPERGPIAAGGRVGEWATGSYAAVGALAGWLSARRTGIGQHIDVSMFEAIVASMTIYHDIQSLFFGGELAQSLETPSIEPASDGWVGLCTYTGQQWKDFCSLIGRPDIGEDKRFYDGNARMNHLAFIQEAMHAFTREHGVDEIIELASLMRIPAAPIGTGETVLRFDHFAERGVFVKNPAGFTQPRTPYLLSGASPRPVGASPKLDEHAGEIRAELSDARPLLRETEGGSAFPLEALRIVDLTAFWAGPVATSMLADLGADVVKVESIQRPDGMRFSGNVQNDASWEWGAVYHGANPGKRGITLRLDDDEGLDLLKRLIAGADVLIDNFSVRVMEHFGLTWEVVHELNPQLVQVRMPAWGLDGPWRDRVGFAPSVEQASGLAWLTGYEDLPLIVRGVCDPVGGMHTVFALLAALEVRRKTGAGLLVEVPLVEPGLNIAAEQVIEYTAYGELLTRQGNRSPVIAPQGVYRCENDAFVALSVVTDTHWSGLCRALGDPEWTREPAFHDAAGRRAAHDPIDTHLLAWCAQQSAEDAADALVAAGVPAARLINAHHIAENPQIASRQYYHALEHPVAGRVRYPLPPMRFSGMDLRTHRSAPPTMGQHNEEVLGGRLGISDLELRGLEARKVIGNRPDFDI
jgi:crotonobetainyl-CoA:carnitine CoA-transferase CaiB-like acyl-CoA transferase